jgi:putative peptidoglycan lipid II flippase
MSSVSTTDGGAGARRSSFLVAAGILLSRLTGLIRESFLAHYFGNSAAADAFKAALKIPNFLQNLLGEGVLSASFIPVYAGLLASAGQKDGRKEEAAQADEDAAAEDADEDAADRLAWAIFSLLALFTSVLVLGGVLLAPFMIDAIAPGFQGEKRELTIRLVRILFPGIGLLVLSAWCLGILNSHRRFFLSYAAPVAMNAVVIAALLVFGRKMAQFPLAVAMAWASVAGSAATFAVQLPTVLRMVGKLRLGLGLRTSDVRIVVANFAPVFLSRGVVQVSSYVDSLLASLLPTGAVAALAYAQTLYLLPVSLFGMSVSAAELPAMSSIVGSEAQVAEFLRGRLDNGLRQIAFFIVPSAVGFLALGDVISAGIYQSGRFTRDDSIYVWGILAGSSIGLLASTLGRLYSSTYYALRDTRTPLRYAIVRVALTSGLGYLCALPLPSRLGIDLKWGVAGLTASAGIAGWIEFTLLRRTLNRRIGRTGLPTQFIVKLWIAAGVAAATSFAIKLSLPAMHPILRAIIVIGPYGILYFGIAAALNLPEARAILKRFRR